MLNPEIILSIALNTILLLLVLVLWGFLRRRIAETQVEQERQSDQLDLLENKMARLEGALFYSPSADWAIREQDRNRPEDDPVVRKRL